VSCAAVCDREATPGLCRSRRKLNNSFRRHLIFSNYRTACFSHFSARSLRHARSYIYIYTSGFATSPPLAIRSVAFAYKTRRLAVYPAQCGYSACGNSRQLARRQPIAELSLRTQRKFPQSVPLGKTRIRQANANLLAPWPGPPTIFFIKLDAHDHPGDGRIPHTKFDPDPLKTVAGFREQHSDRQTDRQTDRPTFSDLYILDGVSCVACDVRALRLAGNRRRNPERRYHVTSNTSQLI